MGWEWREAEVAFEVPCEVPGDICRARAPGSGAQQGDRCGRRALKLLDHVRSRREETLGVPEGRDRFTHRSVPLLPHPASSPTRFPTPGSSSGRSSYGRGWRSRASCLGRYAGLRPGSSTRQRPEPSLGPRTPSSGPSTTSGPKAVSVPAPGPALLVGQ